MKDNLKDIMRCDVKSVEWLKWIPRTDMLAVLDLTMNRAIMKQSNCGLEGVA